MHSETQFQPNWASPPGETILDVLREKALSIDEFASRLGQSQDSVNNLLQGRAAITLGTARKLKEILGGSLEFWMSRDYQFREDLKRLQESENEWIKELPIGDMQKFGWIPQTSRLTDQIKSCLNFFEVPDVKSWRRKFANVTSVVAFRTSSAFDSAPGSVAAWLQQGEIECEKISCQPWSLRKFQESLASIRDLTREKDPKVFLPLLKKICADCGVAVAIVRSPKGCRASGATKFISDQKAMLLLSFRFLTDDHFWFSFFHEAGHLILHGKAGFFVETGKAQLTNQENEANEFAANLLVPREHLPTLLSLSLNGRQVIRFAKQIGVSPGIVVGQMQHYHRIGHGQLNDLKRRYSWSS